jgi:glycosyltransferase involved in cell wall biosynthesis
MKKKILHFIFNLGRGGAETMMVRVIKELPEYEHVVVTLFSMNHFGNELKCSKLICLNLSSLFSLPLAVFKFYKVVKKEKPGLIHTHLFWPTVIARLATPKKYPLITTIHSFIATSVEYKNWHIRFLDKLTYRYRKTIIIAVAKGAMQEYFSFLKLKPFKAYTLYTFVDTSRFNAANDKPKKTSAAFRVVSVGAIREQKNYAWVVKAFEKLKMENIKLDIYGVGNMQEEIQSLIKQKNVKVELKGEVKNIETIIPQYDLYLMASTFEGFSLSVLEAMAMGMPLLLSDIASFREQCEDTAIYFSLTNENDLPEKLVALSKKSREELMITAEKGRQRALQHFTLPQHIEGLKNIYSEALPVSLT